jgi:hypothetical protein
MELQNVGCIYLAQDTEKWSVSAKFAEFLDLQTTCYILKKEAGSYSYLTISVSSSYC